MLLIHIIISVLSLALTGLAVAKPSRALLNVCYGLAGSVFATGAYLTVIGGASVARSCITGIAVLGLEYVGIVLARRKLLATVTE